VTPIEVAYSDEMQSYGLKTQRINFSNPPHRHLKAEIYTFLLCLLETLSSAEWFQVPQFEHNSVTRSWCDIPLCIFS